MKKRSSVLLALLLCGMAILGAACGKQETTTPDTTAGTEPAATGPAAEPPSDLALVADGATSFVLVRPEDGSSAETEVAVLLRKFFEACGVKIKITSDWEGNGVAEQEIVVGDSTRLAEAGLDLHSVGEEGYFACVRGGKLYLAGGSVAATRRAVEQFLTEFFGYAGDVSAGTAVTNVTVPGDYDRSVRQTYPITSYTIDGRDLSEYTELGEGERSGQWETVFTNRDALHAAISDDDGKTWKGFREIALNDIRNASDFRELGNDPAQEHDKSVHQTQALELPGGKVLLAYGQNAAARRMVIFDPDWLLETSREEDFRTGLGNISNHLYVRSLSGGWRGWAGHCAWNRMPGATLVRDPDTDNPPPGAKRSVREVLQLARVRDPRLVSERQGVAWNFPAARKGTVTVECRRVGAGFRLTLADHWMNPCDEVGPARSPFSIAISVKELPDRAWHALTAAWDEDAGQVTLAVDGKALGRYPLASLPPFGLSYLHLQTLAEEADAEGTYFRRFAAKASRPSCKGEGALATSQDGKVISAHE